MHATVKGLGHHRTTKDNHNHKHNRAASGNDNDSGRREKAREGMLSCKRAIAALNRNACTCLHRDTCRPERRVTRVKDLKPGQYRFIVTKCAALTGRPQLRPGNVRWRHNTTKTGARSVDLIAICYRLNRTSFTTATGKSRKRSHANLVEKPAELDSDK